MNKKNYHVDNKSFMIYKDWEELVEMLEDKADAGRLFLALFAYAKRGEVPDFSGELKMLFLIMANALERDGLKWEDKCEQNAINGAKGGRPRKEAV